jgi:hypothetical protein
MAVKPPTRSQLEKQMADLQAQLDATDATDTQEADEVWVKDGDREVRVTGRRATSLLGRLGLLDDDDQDDDQDDDDQDDDQDDVKPAGGGYFGKRR